MIDEAKLFTPRSSAPFWSAVIAGAREHLKQREQTTHAYWILTSQRELPEYLSPTHSLSVILFPQPPPCAADSLFVPLGLSLSPPSSSLSVALLFLLFHWANRTVMPAWYGQSLHVLICIRAVQSDEYIFYWSSFSAMSSTDLDAMKGIPKQYSVFLYERESLRGIHYSISYLFSDNPVIWTSMPWYACVVHCMWAQVKSRLHLLLFSIGVSQSDTQRLCGNSKLFTPLPTLHPNTCFVFVHPGSPTHLTEGINASVLSVSRYMTVIRLLFLLFSLHCSASSFSCQNCAEFCHAQ